LTLELDGHVWLTSYRFYFTSGKEPWYHFITRLGGRHRLSRCVGEKRNLMLLLNFEPQIVEPVASYLYRLHKKAVTCPCYEAEVTSHVRSTVCIKKNFICFTPHLTQYPIHFEVYRVIIPVHTVVTNVNTMCKYCGTPFRYGLNHSQFLYHTSKK